MGTSYEVDVQVRGLDVRHVKDDVEARLIERLRHGKSLVDTSTPQVHVRAGGGIDVVLVLEVDDASLAERQAADLVLAALDTTGIDATERDLDVVVRSSS